MARFFFKKGRVTDDGPAPATYAFDYDGGDGSQRLQVTLIRALSLKCRRSLQISRAFT